MNQVKNLQQLKSLGYFDINTLSQFVEVSSNSLYANIKRWLKEGFLIRLKNGLYVTPTYLDRHAGSDAYHEFIANRLREPSYLSGEYVLQKHNILTDTVFAYTSITRKTKRGYENRLGRFVYRNIKTDLFTGYNICDYGGFQIKIASKPKALFDYLYLKFYKKTVIETDDLNLLRLDLDGFSAQDFESFAQYCMMAGIAKFKLLPEMIRGL